MDTPGIHQHLSQNQKLKQVQHLIMTQQMQQALRFLQVPIMELQSLIDEELEHNPLLELSVEESKTKDKKEEASEKALDFNERDFEVMRQVDEEFRDHFAETGIYAAKQQTLIQEKQKSFIDSLICKEKTLFEHLMQQAQETFENRESLKIAEALIGNFNSYGFIEAELKEIAIHQNCEPERILKILQVIQTFDPPGVGATNLQETLLIQLRRRGKEKALAYLILDNFYDDLLHNRIPLICKKTGFSVQVVNRAVAEIAKLDLHPGMNWSSTVNPHIVPDVFIKEEDLEFAVFVNEDPLPPLRLNQRYLALLQDPLLAKETKEFIHKKIASAKWMLRNLTQRNDTLVQIAHAIVKRQKDFLLSTEGQLMPMIMSEIADELGLHESTIARTVSNKYISTPRGLLAMRSLFTNGYAQAEGNDISSQTVRTHILSIVSGEDKSKPLSDESICSLLEAKGIACARRTIAKYRRELNIGNTRQRKIY